MVKKKFLFFSILIFIFLLSAVSIAGTNSQNVYIISIKEDITPAVYQYIKHNLSIVEDDKNAAAVIFEIDTYGGRVDSAEKISRLILNVNTPTISFVNTKAESAGVLLAISSDTIAMAPGSTIGSAETIPNTEKILSTWVSILKSTAQATGRDEVLVSAMADKSISIPDVISEGRLLNLTTSEAKNLGFADIVVEDYDEILSNLSINYDNIITAETTNSIRLARLASNPYIAPILLAAGFIGLIVEVIMPGFGLGGTISLISFAIYFAGNVLSGSGGLAAILIFLVGIFLLIAEAFAPGIGIAGVGGIISIGISIFLASNNITIALISIFFSLFLTIIGLVLILKYAPKNEYFNRIILDTKLDKKRGYTSTINHSGYIGQIGKVTTALRPSGTILVDGKLLDVVSESQFIEKEELVKVIKVEGRKIIVQKIN